MIEQEWQDDGGCKKNSWEKKEYRRGKAEKHEYVCKGTG